MSRKNFNVIVINDISLGYVCCIPIVFRAIEFARIYWYKRNIEPISTLAVFIMQANAF